MPELQELDNRIRLANRARMVAECDWARGYWLSVETRFRRERAAIVRIMRAEGARPLLGA